MKYVACYIRLLKGETSTAKQKRDIENWLKGRRFNMKSVRWYRDKVTDMYLPRPKFGKLQQDIANGEIRAIVVPALMRLFVTCRQGIEVLAGWSDLSVRIVSLQEGLDFHSNDLADVTTILQGAAEIEASFKRERTKIGLAAAQREGRVAGRPRTTADDEKVRLVKKLRKDRTLSVDDICERVGVSRSTYFRYKQM